MPSSFDLSGWLAPHLEALDQTAQRMFAGIWPERLADAIAYPFFGGGKRIRPALTFAAFEGVGGSGASPYEAAAAIELVHTYSLVHDDLPCMDDDDERRGRPTVHRAFDEATAVLAGDALLTLAFSALNDAPHSAQTRIQMVEALAFAAGPLGMVGGQAADIGLAGAPASDDHVLRVHGAKTGALITASVVLGGLAGSADDDTLRALRAYGRDVGLAFQLADDVLDVDQDRDMAGTPNLAVRWGVGATRRRASELSQSAIDRVQTLPAPAALTALARFSVERNT